MAGRENALKDYVEVNVRIMKFYEKYPNGRIITDMVSWENDKVVVKAKVYRDNEDVVASTGYAYEKEGSSFINKTSALENCETSAVGRALAMLGFEIKKSIASYEEVANAKLNQNATDDKEKKLYEMAKVKGFTPSQVIARCKSKYNKAMISKLTDEEYKETWNALEGAK